MSPVEQPGGGSRSEPEFRVPALYGQHVFLRPVSPEDYRFLRGADLGGDLSVRWRFRGSTPSPEQWAQNLWQGVLAQYLVIGTSDPTPLGLVVAYRASFQDGFAYVAVERFGPPRPVPLLMFGMALFVDYVFSCWNFEKLYIEVAEYNASQFSSGVGRFFELEGRLRRHFWYDGRRWDELIYALYRESWRREARRVLKAARPQGERRLVMRLPNAPEAKDGS